jgi:hypothetical protein
MDPAMKDEGPIPPLLRQINDALKQVKPQRKSQSGHAGCSDGDGRSQQTNVLGLLRSTILLWSAQNAMLRGDAPVARDWMTNRLGAVSDELDGILARLEILGVGRHTPENDGTLPALTMAMDNSACDVDDFELIDFAPHLHGQRGT